MGHPHHPTIELPGKLDDLAALVAAAPLDPHGVRDEFVAALSGGDARPGHLCASAWTLDSDLRHALLVDHPRFGWMPPGGHVVAGETIFEAAARELTEETGVPPLEQHLLSVHATMIPAKGTSAEHVHYTLGVVSLADRHLPLGGEADQPAAWWPLDEELPVSFFGDNPLLREFARLLA